MKKFSIFILSSLAIVVMGCTTEQTEPDQLTSENLFKVYEAKVDNALTREGENCLEVELIAGQNHIAGLVTAETIDGLLKITYSAGPDWTIGATHLSLGECEQIPTTGSGNPKIGHFEHSSEHSEGVNEVVYEFPIEYLLEDFCFAAHAEVTGPTGGETAWASGTEFDGNSWAMFVEALLNGCTSGGGDDDEPVVK
ncbi:MAG: hypothetical protein HKN00_02745 [Flavobacteriaceae bacterium]|nr:hypothetical protein [Bacteroidia bacterium]MBT8288893.1 hypothetical protein [Bacteroidia bacterium]NNF74076.1 hypothetical protein [Flavobacteriaceae bacterium]NNK73566.1 hypothetical protein [Flavobacteriaceae bacterium]